MTVEDTGFKEVSDVSGSWCSGKGRQFSNNKRQYWWVFKEYKKMLNIIESMLLNIYIIYIKHLIFKHTQILIKKLLTIPVG